MRKSGTVTVAAVDLLDDRECAAQCLLAREPGGLCICRCSGRYHGALIAANVTPVSAVQAHVPRRRIRAPVESGTLSESARPWFDGGDADWWRFWWDEHADAAWDILDMVCPVIEVSGVVKAYWDAEEETRDGERPPLVWATHSGTGWNAHLSMGTPWEHFTDEAAATMTEFLAALTSSPRSKYRQAHTDQAGVRVSGLGHAEAQVTGEVLSCMANGVLSHPRTVEAMRAIKVAKRYWEMTDDQ